MSKESRIEEQIQQFYDNVPNVNDALPLKDYLLKHEDSRMAWYLLGKQYEGQGEHAKAAYCFGQAGEIYEAFESKPAPKLPNEASDRVKSKSRRRKLLLVPAALLLIVGFSAFLVKPFPFWDLHSEQGSEEPQHSTERAQQAEKEKAIDRPPAPVSKATPPSFIAAISDSDNQGQKALGEVLTGDTVSQPMLLVRSQPLGSWTDWLKSGKPVANVTTDGKAGMGKIDWYDPKWCECRPQDSRAVQAKVQVWKPLQEQKLALRSAMIRYRERNGKWPPTPESLAGAYPANTMAGWTEQMSEWFDELKGVIDNKRDGKIPKTVGWPESSGAEPGAGMPAGLFAPLTEQPLAVIVDKSNHRLAVVSGNVLLRNYKVGLGGGRTPEGDFVITEKVRNPNGRSDGEFGSRGMTLSDSLYGIHGTNEPDSMGKDESLGCIRMTKEDLEELYDLVPIGTTVTIAKGGLPDELRVPPERFRLTNTQDETNPNKVYNWLN